MHLQHLPLKALVAAERPTEAAKAVLTLSRSRNQAYWSNTFGTAQSIDALIKYVEFSNETTGDLTTYEVLVNGESIQTGTLQELFDREEIAITVPEAGAEVEVKASNDGLLFSTITWDQFRTSKELASKNEGLLVHRSYDGQFVPGETVYVTLTVQGESINRQPMVIEDFLPAGLVPVNTNLQNENRDRNRYRYNQEFKDDGVIVAYRWWNGSAVKHTYQARVVSQGSFTAPPPVASLMYLPEVHGRGQTHTILVTDDQETAGVIFNSDPELTAPKITESYGDTYWRQDEELTESPRPERSSMPVRTEHVFGFIGVAFLVYAAVLMYRRRQQVPAEVNDHAEFDSEG